MRNILVTGGCGFIGSNYINDVLANGTDRIVNLDTLNYCASESNVKDRDNPRYTFIKGSITDEDLVSHILAQYEIDTIIHFAAQSHVDNSFSNSIQYTIDNVLGTHVLLECGRQYGKLHRFIHFSTDEVYGEVDESHPGCHERSLLNPTNPYAATKAGAEFMVRSYNHSFQMPTIIVRCNNVYGPNQYEEKLIPRFIKLIKEGQKLTIHGDGSTRRNFIHVSDVVDAVSIILEKGEIGEIYNIGTLNEHSVLDIARLLLREIKGIDSIDDHIIHVKDRPYNDHRYMVNTDRLRSLGWSERANFIEKVRELIH